MAQALTERQREVYEYIKRYIDTNHYAPSFREIADFMKVSSIHAVVRHVERLQSMGLIIMPRDKTGGSGSSRKMTLANVDVRNSLTITHKQLYDALTHVSKAGKPVSMDAAIDLLTALGLNLVS